MWLGWFGGFTLIIELGLGRLGFGFGLNNNSKISMFWICQAVTRSIINFRGRDQARLHRITISRILIATGMLFEVIFKRTNRI